MADEIQAGICGGTWWNTSGSVLVGGGMSPCSMVNASDHFGMINYGSSCKESNSYYNNIFVSSSTSSAAGRTSIYFENSQKPQLVHSDSDSGGSSILTDWNQSFINASGHQESGNYNSIIQEEINLGVLASTSGEDSTIINAFKSTNDNDKSPLVVNGSCSNSTTHDGFSMESQISLIQSLFDDSPTPSQQEHQIQDSIFNTNESINYSYGANRLNESLVPAFWSKEDSLFHKPLPSSKHQQEVLQQPCGLQFSNINEPYWNVSTNTNGYSTASNDAIRASPLPSLQPHQLLASCFDEKPNCSNLGKKLNNDKARNTGSSKRENEPAFKRPRIQTPSPLPTFKVRKEKLGDRITALQQLVSPFGKTDTASVLHEAIEYIKFLHDQVNVLSTPYMKNGNHVQHKQSGHTLKELEGPKHDLRSRGLCLVPISSTFPVASETTSDFWTPTFGATFR